MIKYIPKTTNDSINKLTNMNDFIGKGCAGDKVRKLNIQKMAKKYRTIVINPMNNRYRILGTSV